MTPKATTPNTQIDSQTVLLDSLLHSNIKRVVAGGVCGLASGFILLFTTSLVTPVGASKLWWLQLMASACYGGNAASFEASSSIFTHGAIIHFGVSLFLGVMVGKMTTTGKLPTLLAYGLVLGALCWLSSNMFAPDIFNITALSNIAQWTRMFLFQSFTLSLALFMAISSKALNI
jgi:hypothetical protein